MLTPRLGGCAASPDREYACVLRSQPTLLEPVLGISRRACLHGEWLARPEHSGVSGSGCRGGGDRPQICFAIRADRRHLCRGQVRSGAAARPGRCRGFSQRAIKDASVEKPTPVDPAPEMASSVSGKTYKFPDNELKLKSLSLFLTDQHPHVQFEYARDATNSSAKHDVPIGLDGFYRRGSPFSSGPAAGYAPATKGTWLNEQGFAIDLQLPELGAQRKYRPVVQWRETQSSGLRRGRVSGGGRRRAGGLTGASLLIVSPSNHTQGRWWF